MNKTKNTLLTKMFTILRTLISYILVGFIIVIFFIPAFLLMFLPDRYRYDNKLLFWLLYITNRAILWALFLPIRVISAKTIPNEPAIFIANHQSSLDIPLASKIIGPRPHVWYALDYYLKFPFLGFIIKKIGIPVSRTDSQKDARALVRGIQLLKNQNRSLMIFPEGGRFIDDTIHPFLSGFIYLAEKIERPIIPFYIHNAGKVYPPGSFLAHNYPITLVVGEPLRKEADESSEDFLSRIHAWFVKQQEICQKNNC